MKMPNILVAEDDPDTRELLKIILSRADFRVTVTDDPTRVLELLSTDNFDALLLDNLMPKINGIELCRVIRSVNATIVICFCSGAVGESDQRLRLMPVLKVILQSLLSRRNSFRS